MPTELAATPTATDGRDDRRRATRLGWPRAALIPAVGGVAGLLVVQRAVLDQPGYLVSRPALLSLTLLWWALGLVTAALLVLAAPRRLAVGLLLAVTIAIPAVALTRGPRLSDDLYRYAWDGRVQAAGIDPYRYGPLDAHLDGLRDTWLFPNSAGCTAAAPQMHCTRLNYPRAHTVYPPVAEAYFTAVHALPGPAREHKLQLYASLLSLGLVGLLMTALVARGRDPRYAGFYALTPLAGIDSGSDAHVDVLGALFVLGALMILTPRGQDGPIGLVARLGGGANAGGAPEAAPSPTWRRALLAGALLGAAVAVKLYPVLLLAAAIRRRPVSVLAAAAGVVGLSYVPHVAAVGTAVIGFLPQYLRVEGYEQGSRFLLLAGLGLHGSVAKAVAVCVLGAVVVAVLRSDPRRVPVEHAALWLVGAAFLVATPAQPWYGVLLAMLAIVAGRLEWLAVPIASYVLYISLFVQVPVDAWTLRVSAYGIAAFVVAAVGVLRVVRARWPSAPSRSDLFTA
jgi:Glycosyltransferase family 87